jgi:diphthine-ammonia ligase
MKINKSLREKLEKLRSEEILENKEDIIPKLGELLINSVEKRIPKNKKVGIAFSGGVDSSLLAFICDKLDRDFTLYAVGFENAKDIESAQRVALDQKWKLKIKIIQLEDCEEIFKKVIGITDKHDVITAGVGSVTYSVLEIMKEDIILTGLGSEELYAGYERHKGDINKACWEGLLGIYERDILRDLPLVKHFGKEILLPFLDKDLIEYSMKISGDLKVGEYKKQILREAAVSLGMPREIAFRKKLAAQYGSKFDYAIKKLAKKKGLNKREYLTSL